MTTQTNLNPSSMHGTFATRPVATTVPVGTTYTDETQTVWECTTVGGVSTWISMTGPTGPQGPPGSAHTLQTLYVELAVDSSTISNAYAVLLTQNITTTSGKLIFNFTCSSSNTLNNIHDNIFGIFIDGVKQCSAGFTSTGTSHHDSVAMVKRVTGVVNGLHTITIQWKTGGGVLSCNPTSDENDFASLLIDEVTV